MSPRNSVKARAGRKGGQTAQALITSMERQVMGRKGMLSRWYGINPDDVPPGLELVHMRICIPTPALKQLHKWIEGALGVEKNWVLPENEIIKTCLTITQKQLKRTWERHMSGTPQDPADTLS